MPDASDSRSRREGRLGASLWLQLDILHEAGDWSEIGDRDALVERAGAALAGHARFADQSAAEACVALSDDATVRDLNARFRGKDTPTNVLSFPSLPGPGDRSGDGGDRSLGDIVLAQETLAREAREQGVPFADHLQHLVVHGLLHLLDFDHEAEAEAREMEALEIEILATLGVGDPYGDDVIATTP